MVFLLVIATVAPQVWAPVKDLPSRIASRSDYYGRATFSLRHNVLQVQRRGETASFIDLDTLEPSYSIAMEAERDATGNLKLRVSDQAGYNVQFLLGEKEWSLTWRFFGVGKLHMAFVRNTDEQPKVVPLKGDLSGFGLMNVPTEDGGFISIRSDVDLNERKLLGHRLLVYQLKNGCSTLLARDSKKSPFAVWAGQVIPTPPGPVPDFQYWGIYSGIPEKFSPGGIALARNNRSYYEWSVDDPYWRKLQGPFNVEEQIRDAFFCGTSLYVQTELNSRPMHLWCRDSKGRWHLLGEMRVLARDGGRHLMVGEGDFDGYSVKIYKAL